jgi:ABC-type branched-subunit amino acid transport system substrate-binding protein
VAAKSRPLVVAAGLALALAAGACGGDGGDGGEKLDLVIGDSIPLSGDLEYLGPAAEKASELAVEEIDSAMDEAGGDDTVTVVHEDNETDEDIAVKVASRMTRDDGATCITGAWASDDTLSTAEQVAIPDEILQISPASLGDEITVLDDDGLVNRTVPSNTAQSKALVDSISKNLDGSEGRTVNVGARGDSYGDELSQAFIEAWQDAGGTIGGQVIYSPEPISVSGSTDSDSTGFDESSTSGESSFDAPAQQITEGSPDAIVIADYPSTFAGVAEALEGTGTWDPETTWGTDRLATIEVPDQAGSDLVEGMRTVAPGSPKGDEAATAFNELFKSSDPTDVQQAGFDAQQFDATILCYLAAVAAGSTEGQAMADALVDLTAPGGEEYTWQELPDAIEALRDGEDIDYTGASGPIDMDSNGDATAGVFDVFQFSEGRPKGIGEIEVPPPKGTPAAIDTETETETETGTGTGSEP